MSGRTPLVDRAVARLGARELVAQRRGMGWMMVELIPVAVWIRLTGAQFLASYYLPRYLLLLGCEEEDLAWLPIVHFAGILIATAATLWLRREGRRLAHPRTSCLRWTWAGRIAFLGLVLWPWGGHRLGWETGTILTGTFSFLFASQVLLIVGVHGWASWTQALIPDRLRGAFFAWRNIAGLASFGLVIAALSLFWPESADDDAMLGWFQGMFLLATIACLASTLMLQAAPAAAPPADGRPPPRVPIRALTGELRPLLAYCLWNFCFFGAYFGLFTTYQVPLLAAGGIDSKLYATIDAWVRTPTLIGGMLVGMRLHHRAGGHICMLASQGLVIAAMVGYLTTSLAGTVPLAFPAAAAEGLGLGIFSVSAFAHMQRLCPPEDPRFPAIYLGMGALGGLGQALLVGFGDGWLAALAAATAWTSGQLVVGFALAMLIISLPFLRRAR